MTANYTETPSNMADIMKYVIVDKNTYTQEILNSEKCFFYDTCAFRKHANLKHPETLFEFLKRKNGIIIITRTIIMELASASKHLNIEYVNYLMKMHQAGLKIIVMYEEDLFNILSHCFSSNAQINKYLDIAVRVAKSPAGTISDVYKSDRKLRTDVMSANITDTTLFKRFFHTVRNNKEPGDNLGEEMIAICIHMLSNIPELYDYKYIVLTEDKGAIRLINKTRKNISEYMMQNTVTAVTSVVLAQKIYQENLISTKTQIEEFISTNPPESMITIVASEEYDLEPQEKIMSSDEISNKIMTPHAIHIYV